MRLREHELTSAALRLVFGIRCLVKVHKEGKERENVHKIYRCHSGWCLRTTRDEDVHSLRIHANKLDELSESQVFFPPDVFGVHGDKVVRVHHGVNQTIENNGQVHIAVEIDMQIQPVYQKNSRVMVDVEEAQLFPFLADYDEECVCKVKHLRPELRPRK